MLEILRDPAWQGIGAIVGIIGIGVTLWLARHPISATTSRKVSWRIFAVILSLALPVYAIFAGSIILANSVTQTAQMVVYFAVAIASLLGVLWGAVWATYIQKAFFAKSNNVTSRDISHSGG